MRASRIAAFFAVGLLGLALSLVPGWSVQSSPAGPNSAMEPGVFDVAELPYLGHADAKVTIVEFTDYQCPFCLRHLSQTFPQINKEYIETGKVRYIVRDFPLAHHAQAFQAAEASHCAADQGKFWPMHEWLFVNQKALSQPAMVEQAGVLGMETDAFGQCLRGGKYAARVRQAFIEGLRSGVEGTPAFFLGHVEQDGKFRSQLVIVGAHPYARFKEELDSLLVQN